MPSTWPRQDRNFCGPGYVPSIDTPPPERYTTRTGYGALAMENIFLACFVFGALFTLASLVLGMAGHEALHLGHGHAPAAAPGHVVGHDAAQSPVHGSSNAAEHLPLLNASSVVGALTWFGAAGYLLTRLSGLATLAILLGALLAGAIGWYLVARFLGLVLRGERVMDPAEYRLVGTIGRLTVSIPSGGTGEVVFSKAGTRRSEAARAEGGSPIPKGTEVVITAYAAGFATVQPWGEFLAAHNEAAARNREA
jgi:membrane protein implicated in regulation of membrane protease activity